MEEERFAGYARMQKGRKTVTKLKCIIFYTCVMFDTSLVNKCIVFGIFHIRNIIHYMYKFQA